MTFVYENVGKIGHTLTIEGKEDDLLLRVSAGGQPVSGSLPLSPGTYVLFCDLKGHRELGMEGTQEVTAATEDSLAG